MNARFARPVVLSLALMVSGPATVAAIAQSPAGATTESVTAPEERVYKTTPQGELRLYIFRPAHDTARSRRAMIFAHGGGWHVGEAAWTFGTARHYASRGLVGVSVQYRLSDQKTITPADAFEDVRDAIRWLRRNAATLRIDPAHIAAHGVSAGGQLVAAAALAPNPVDSTGTDGRPNVVVLRSAAVAAAQDGWFRRLVGDRMSPAQLSPDSLVRPGAAPALVLVGEEDTVTPLRGARGFCERMRAVQARCDLVSYPGVGHLFTRNLDPRAQEQGPFDTDPAISARARDATDSFLQSLGYLKR